MDDQLIRKVLSHLDEGHRVLFEVDYFGSARIKVKYGFLNARTQIYETDAMTVEAIKDRLAPESNMKTPCARPPSKRNEPSDGQEIPQVVDAPELAGAKLFDDHQGKHEASGNIDRWKAYARSYRTKAVNKMSTNRKIDEKQHDNFS